MSTCAEVSTGVFGSSNVSMDLHTIANKIENVFPVNERMTIGNVLNGQGGQGEELDDEGHEVPLPSLVQQLQE